MKSRTTVTAERSDLDTLRAEAARRGLPLSAVLAEAVTEKAESIRKRRRPQVGVARSRDGRTAAALTSEPVARSPR